MQPLHEGVQLSGRPCGAHALPRTCRGLQVPLLREVLLQALAAAGPHQDPHWGEAFRLQPVLESFRGQEQLEGSHPDPLRGEAFLLHALLQEVRPQVLSVQARGVKLLPRLSIFGTFREKSGHLYSVSV